MKSQRPENPAFPSEPSSDPHLDLDIPPITSPLPYPLAEKEHLDYEDLHDLLGGQCFCRSLHEPSLW